MLTMQSRERVKKAVHFDKPDRVPHFLPDGQENDIIWLWCDRPDDIQPWQTANGIESRIDCRNVRWERPCGIVQHGEVTEFPIKDITQQKLYKFPDLNNCKYLENVKKNIIINNSSPDPKYCLGVMPFNSLNGGTHDIIGLANMFMAYYDHPDDLHALIGRLAEAQRDSIRILADLGCDGVMGYDDWGLQDRLMAGLESIKKFFIPHYKRNWQLAHDLGMDVWMHSCGYIIDLLPELASAGLNVIQMDQQEHIGLDALNDKMGGRIAFWCPVDVQKKMIEGSVEDIKEYARYMIQTLGAHDGGFISMTYSTPESVGHTPEKIKAMCAAFREYGHYNKSCKH
jgi:hypothetical protein